MSFMSFFETGKYDKNRLLHLTTSPSMDILISSNLERLLFEVSNRDDKKVKLLINNLNTKGFYEIDEDMKLNLSTFHGEYATEVEVKNIENLNEFDILEELSLETNTKIPLPIKNLKAAKILHNRNCEKYHLKKEIENILKI